MKQSLAFLLVFLMTQLAYAQKKQNNLLDLTQGQIENCTLENGKTLISNSHKGRLYLPVESYKGIEGLTVMYSKFEKIGDVTNNNIGSITVKYTDEDGNEKTATWTFYHTGKKNLRFDAWEIDHHGNTVSISPEYITDIYMGIGLNKKVDVTVSIVK